MIDSRTAHNRMKTQFGQVLPLAQWRSNASDLLAYYGKGTVDASPYAPWRRWYSTGLWVSEAVHRAMEGEG